jgi:hypothetical protein
MAQQPTRMKRGDTAPIFDAILRDSNGDALDLAVGDVATFWMRDAAPPRATKIAGSAMVIVAPGAAVGSVDRGRVTYAWAAADTDTPGKFDAEVELTRAGGTVETFPNVGAHRVEIGQDIG